MWELVAGEILSYVVENMKNSGADEIKKQRTAFLLIERTSRLASKIHYKFLNDNKIDERDLWELKLLFPVLKEIKKYVTPPELYVEFHKLINATCLCAEAILNSETDENELAKIKEKFPKGMQNAMLIASYASVRQIDYDT